jgi:riboflavin kinase/FMN adenylyltransferase
MGGEINERVSEAQRSPLSTGGIRGQILLGDGPPLPPWPQAVVCIGTFDGVHQGHRAVIEHAISEAREMGLPAGVVTFDRHPAEVIAPSRAPAAIVSLGEKLRLLLDLGPEFVLVLPFDSRLKDTPAEEFLEQILRRKAKAVKLVIGHDFAMGRDRSGTADWLRGQIPTLVVPPREQDGLRVSSSAVRQALQEGDLELVAALLGRHHAIEGVVVGGDRIGRELGYPTANLALHSGLVVPSEGVYIARAVTPFGTFPSALSIGTRPTVDGSSLAVEAFLLNYPGQPLYGRQIRVELLKFLRKQERFNSLETLKEQIGQDVSAVQSWFH